LPPSRDRVELVSRIRDAKARLGAVVLCHNYQVPEVYEVADFIGDSLELARQASAVRSRLIVFCGVRFMAETAKLLNPDATVILAEPGAGCEMADMISAEALVLKKRELGAVQVLAYVNTTAAVKAESDICCTSANAVSVMKSLGVDRPVLFVPDRNLAAWVARETGRPLSEDGRMEPGSEPGSPRPDAPVVPWQGFCYVHAQFTADDVARARREHPAATVIVHPECRPEVIAAADRVAPTSGMLRIAAGLGEVVLGTEAGMCNRVRRELPATTCWPLRRTALCRNMKLTSLDSVLAALEGRVAEIAVPAGVAGRARAALERMMAVA
jgi:quinolinate synthase